jgi:hypothetical protein
MQTNPKLCPKRRPNTIPATAIDFIVIVHQDGEVRSTSSSEHDEKHDEQTTSTFHGITVVSSDAYRNAFDSICVDLESDSNVMDEGE